MTTKNIILATMATFVLLVFSAPSFAEIDWSKFTFAHEDCSKIYSKNYKDPSIVFHCIAEQDANTTFGNLYSYSKKTLSFEEFKEINNLGDKITKNSIVPAYTFYAFSRR